MRVKTKIMLIKSGILFFCIFSGLIFAIRPDIMVALLIIFVFNAEYISRISQVSKLSFNKYCFEGNNEIHLVNKNATIIYDYKKNRLVVRNLLDIEENFYMNSSVLYKPFNIFETIHNYFDMSITYDALLYGFKKERIEIVEHRKKINRKNQAKTRANAKKNQICIPSVDINSAKEDEIAKLPGINIVRAKKAIKYRIEHNGFKTKDEFYKITKIKLRFIDIVDNSLLVGQYSAINEYNAIEIQQPQQEVRQVDF